MVLFYVNDISSLEQYHFTLMKCYNSWKVAKTLAFLV